ncbi:MAG: hypothetical protein MJ175_01475 [Clostridia bacterium]|nr:hypothetical protein [Clostridia bacterium]
MSEFANYMEYCVEKKSEGSYRTKRILLRVVCIIAALAIIPIVTWSVAGKLFVTFVPVWMGLMGILYWFLSRFVNIEYEYRIVQGEFQMDIIYGQRQRKQLVATRIRAMEVIRPLDDDHIQDVENCTRIIDCSISRKHPPPAIYYLIYTDENRNRVAVIFEATRKAMEIMKFYNSSALVVKPDLRH